jgi:DNA-binding transcriptional regulator LsrR (DeoR family)
MNQTITEDQVTNAARELDQDEFTRADLAAKLGVERKEMKRGFKAARQAGSLEKVRTDGDGTGCFRLSG